jgi:hypothetical protein
VLQREVRRRVGATPFSSKTVPHIGSYSGRHVDYNGVGIWSIEGIRKRYQDHAKALGVHSFQLIPRRHAKEERTWVYPLMEQIIERIEAGDGAAIEIGIEFIEENDFFVFGRVLKSNTARALRRTDLTERQRQRVRERLVGMMLAGKVLHEFREFKRLLRRLGPGSLWTVLDGGVDRDNKYVMRYYEYLNRYAR